MDDTGPYAAALSDLEGAVADGDEGQFAAALGAATHARAELVARHGGVGENLEHQEQQVLALAQHTSFANRMSGLFG